MTGAHIFIGPGPRASGDREDERVKRVHPLLAFAIFCGVLARVKGRDGALASRCAYFWIGVTSCVADVVCVLLCGVWLRVHRYL